MQAVEYLNRLKWLESEIEKLEDEEKVLWSLATSVTPSMDGMPHASGENDKMTASVNRIIKAKEATAAIKAEYALARLGILAHIKMLPSKQYDVLYWLYVKKRENRKKGQKWYYTWSEVAENLGCSEENIRKTRRRAIKNLQKILDSEQRLLEVG